jgi:hypothetical protein
MTRPAVTADGPQFLLGTHQPGWLNHAGVPLFVSDVRLRVYKRLPLAAAPWACDSGGFSELKQYGTWTVPPREYVARLRRYRDEIGRLMWAAAQDWMCEPIIRAGGWAGRQFFVGTHRSVDEHQWRTVLNFLHLRDIAPDLPIVPVVQGFTRDEYLRCVDLYWSLGRVDLTTEPLCGVGSICRRQGTAEAGRILAALRARGLRNLHGFGFKILGLADHSDLLVSADSMAWSDTGRKFRRPVCGHAHLRGAKNCANCIHYALQWRTAVLAAAGTPNQEGLAA